MRKYFLVLQGRLTQSSDYTTLAQTAHNLRMYCALAVGRWGEHPVKDLIARTVQHFGGLDILVNNAGIAPFKPIDEFTSAEFSRVLDVNLKGPWLCAK
jgi:NAD(P)-dependent dehydrogenase (short-subunit alcohol dehydrogenase family)